jgi:hypothetical protein
MIYFNTLSVFPQIHHENHEDWSLQPITWLTQTWYKEQAEMMRWPGNINICDIFQQSMLKNRKHTAGVVHKGSERINFFSYNSSQAKTGYVHNISIQIQ